MDFFEDDSVLIGRASYRDYGQQASTPRTVAIRRLFDSPLINMAQHCDEFSSMVGERRFVNKGLCYAKTSNFDTRHIQSTESQIGTKCWFHLEILHAERRRKT